MANGLMVSCEVKLEVIVNVPGVLLDINLYWDTGPSLSITHIIFESLLNMK